MKITSGEGRLRQLLQAKKTDAELADELFLIALGRLPKDHEPERIRRHLEQTTPVMGGRVRAFEDIMWALINTKEFIFNH